MKINLMISILCFYISVQITAEDEEKHWPVMPPAPKTVDRSKHLRYGKPVQLFTAEQRKSLWDARIRKDHPRIYFNQDTLPDIRIRMKTHPAYSLMEKHAIKGHPIANAFVYQITGDQQFAQKALEIFNLKKWNTRTMDPYLDSLVFDWCYDAIPSDDMEDVIKMMSAHLPDEKTDKGINEKSFRPNRWGRPYPRRPMPLGRAHCFMALAHHWPGAHVELANYWHPDYSNFGAVIAGQAWPVDGSILRAGYNWRISANAKYGQGIWRHLEAFVSATGIDLFNQKKWGINIHNYLYWVMYNTDLENGHYIDMHHAFPGHMSPLAFRNNFQYPIYTYNFHTRNPHYQWFINKILYPQGIVNSVKYLKERPQIERLIEIALWYDPSIPEKKPENLPYGRFLVPSKLGFASFRSGFKGKGDTIAWFSVCVSLHVCLSVSLHVHE